MIEEWARLHRLELSAAIRACRRREIADLKTEGALLGLADHLGRLPQPGCFVHELPEE